MEIPAPPKDVEEFLASAPLDFYKDDLNKPPNEEILTEHLRDLSNRCKRFLEEMERLRGEAKKREHDTTEMINHNERKVKDNDARNKALAQQLKQLTLDQLTDKKKMKKHFETTLQQAEKLFLEKEAQLLETNKHLMQELSDLSQFKKMRHHLSLQLEATKQTIETNEIQHQKQLQELKERFEEARSRLEKEADDRIAHSRQLYKEEVGKELDVDSRRIRRENKMMEKEYLFHKETTKGLQQHTRRLELNIKNLKKELLQTQEKDEEHARKALRQSQLITELKKKKNQLQQGINTVQTEGKEGRQATKQLHKSIVNELALESKSLQDQARLKYKELDTLKSHARTILQQRNEVEKLFLKCLERAKDKVHQRRVYDYSEAKRLYDESVKDSLVVPAYNTGVPPVVVGAPPKPSSKAIGVKDLTDPDKKEMLTTLTKAIFRSLSACSHMGCPPFLTERVEGQATARRCIRGDPQQLLQLGWSRPETDASLQPPKMRSVEPPVDSGSFFITDQDNDIDDIM